MAKEATPAAAAPAEIDLATLIPGGHLLGKRKPAEAPAADVVETPLEEEPSEVIVPEGELPTGEEEPEEAEEEPTGSLTPGVQKRIDKLTAKRKEAEERATALEAQLASLQTRAEAAEQEAQAAKAAPKTYAPPTAENPLSDVNDMVALRNIIEQALKIKEWATEHLDEGVMVSDGKGGERFAEPKELRKHLAQADKLLTIHAPARAQHLQAKVTSDDEAKAAYPALFDTAKPEYQQVQSVINVLPELSRFHDSALFLGDWLRGKTAREAEAKATASNGGKKPVAKPALAPPVQKPTAAPRAAASKVNQSEALSRVLKRGGKPEDITAFFLTK